MLFLDALREILHDSSRYVGELLNVSDTLRGNKKTYEVNVLSLGQYYI